MTLKFEIIYNNYSKCKIYLRHGKKHRDNGSAYISQIGDQYWFQYGLCHRDGDPAVIWCAGYQAWYYRDLLHRDDGPAVTYSDGEQEWHIHGKCIKYDP
jgi:hypothetical protein